MRNLQQSYEDTKALPEAASFEVFNTKKNTVAGKPRKCQWKASKAAWQLNTLYGSPDTVVYVVRPVDSGC